MVTVVFRPEAGLTLFLRMRSKGIAKSLSKCMPIEELQLPYYGNSRPSERMVGPIFDRKHLNSRFHTSSLSIWI